ncbi:NAD(P)/FAD-dependent oxidoreductase [Marinobacterium jannaschii]|uniref:NAD(P)/FAD-dependent oxidoreductase n=1 Tax=Marinobacterium jannaschii TaxID=64970 RepID=UPI0004845CCF|nr:FAD/NAD(P)-binding oxidoreductase [Marinobacterium jannaschii]
MARVVIVGASTGGLPMAYDIRKALSQDHEVTVVSNTAEFQFVPSNPWVAVGWRKPEDITFPLEPALVRKGIDFIHCAARHINAEHNQLLLSDGRVLDYDYLVLATGPKLTFDEVEGLGPNGGFTNSICTTGHAIKAFDQWQTFCERPGHTVVGAVQGVSCFGPAYEFAMIMDKDLRKRKLRDRVPMTFITPEPYIGHMGLGGVGDSKTLLESEFRQRHINWICNAKVTRITSEAIYVDELDAQGALLKQHELPNTFSMLMPPFKGVDLYDDAPQGLVNPRGFVQVDAFNRNPVFPNIYALGVGIAIPPLEATPVPVGVPKTGLMIEGMVTAICANIKAETEGREPQEQATWNTICLADMGDTGVAFVALPQLPPRNVTWARKGKWVHLAKVAFEKYFLHNMKNGNAEPVYQKYILKMLGIARIRSDEKK